MSTQLFGSLELAQQAEAADAALAPGGVLNYIARQLVANESILSPEEAGDLLLPQRGGVPRWELLADASQIRKELITARAADIGELATRVGLRQPVSIDPDKLRLIREDTPTIVEGGANKTFVVRPYLAEEVNNGGKIFQIATNRAIPKNRRDGTLNPERAVVSSLFLDKEQGDTTENQVAHAVALDLGFEFQEEQSTNGGTFTRYSKQGSPDRIIVNPNLENNEEGLIAGMTAVDEYLNERNGTRLGQEGLVVVSNGQYGTKNKLLAQIWAQRHGRQFGRPPITIGDEAGYEVIHHDDRLITAPRPPALYVNEAVVVTRLAARLREFPQGN